jgi:hypothetical protein
MTGSAIDDLSRSNSLPELAARIRAEHEATSSAIKNSVAHGIAVGELLLEAKAKVPHGQWLPWLAENCAMSERTARNYMRLVRLGVKSATVADLGLRATLKKFAKRHDPFPNLSFNGRPGVIWLKGTSKKYGEQDFLLWSEDACWTHLLFLGGSHAWASDRPMKADSLRIGDFFRALGIEGSFYIVEAVSCPYLPCRADLEEIKQWCHELDELRRDLFAADSAEAVQR